MGATLIGVLAIVAAVVGLIVWAMITWLGLTQALAILFIFTCLMLMLIILIQKPKGGGLSGAFGGAGGGQQAAFGAKTGDVLTIVTVCLFALFLGLAMGLTWSTQADMRAISLEEEQTTESTDAAVPPGALQTEIPVVPAPGSSPTSTDAPASTGAGTGSESQP